MFWVGISIGFVVGVVTGMIVLTIVRTLASASIKDSAPVKTLSVQLLAVVSIVTGATFLVSLVSHEFTGAEVKEVTVFYFYALASTYGVMLFYPFYRLIHRMGREFGE